MRGLPRGHRKPRRRRRPAERALQSRVERLRVDGDRDNRHQGHGDAGISFTRAELTGIVAYLRNMREFNAGAVARGDASRGQTVFEGAGGCASCHRVQGKGPRLAPDLSSIGAVRTAAELERAVVDPSSAIQFENRSIRAVTRDGRTLTGRRLNEDTYSVQIIDDQERLVSITKADLREYSVITKPSMPAYKDRLSSQDVSNVVAYLLTLKGVR